MRFALPTLLLLPVFAVFFALGGCATATRSVAPGISLVDLRPIEATAFETRLRVTVRVTNREDAPLTFSGSRHELTINGRAMGSALGAESLTVPALSTATQETTLNLSNFALIALARELQRQPTARYSIRSTLFTPGLLKRSVTAESMGEIDLGALAEGR